MARLLQSCHTVGSLEYLAAHKQRWEVPGVGAGLFFHLRRKMFGENQQVDPDLVGNQDEAQARRSIYATRKLIVSEGRLVSIDEVQWKGKGGKSSGRESSRAERRDESTPKERSRRGEREESKFEGKRGVKQTLTSEGGKPGEKASWGDYRPPPADRDRPRGREGGRRDEQSETEKAERSRSVREPTVSFRSPQREDEGMRGIRMPARTTEAGAETNIILDAIHVGGGRSRGKMSVRSNALAGEESQAERQRKADREARLKSRVKQPRDDDDDDDDVMN